MEPDELATVELEIIPSAGLRATATKVQETALGKRNRISIGHPYVTRVKKSDKKSLLGKEDLQQFGPDKHAFYLLNLSITLLPDTGCRFRSVEFFVELEPAENDLPLILRLEPEEEKTIKTLKQTIEKSVRAGVTDTVIKIVEAGASESISRGQEWESQLVNLESFGAQTQQAGWQFRLTDARDIPLNARGLRLLCVGVEDVPITAEFKVVSEIEILTPLDRWISFAFRRKADSEVTLNYTIGKPTKSEG